MKKYCIFDNKITFLKDILNTIKYEIWNLEIHNKLFIIIFYHYIKELFFNII
jgi:hypothetical protein